MNKKFQKELAKGGWKNLDKLFEEVKENDYPISVLYKDGTVENATWNYSFNWIKTELRYDEPALWSERRPDVKNWFEKLLDKIGG